MRGRPRRVKTVLSGVNFVCLYDRMLTFHQRPVPTTCRWPMAASESISKASRGRIASSRANDRTKDAKYVWRWSRLLVTKEREGGPCAGLRRRLRNHESHAISDILHPRPYGGCVFHGRAHCSCTSAIASTRCSLHVYLYPFSALLAFG